jgi:putative cell wall-binding protein
LRSSSSDVKSQEPGTPQTGGWLGSGLLSTGLGSGLGSYFSKKEEEKPSNASNENVDKSNHAKELIRLQMMLLELKSTRAELLEKMDDLEHENHLLKQQLTAPLGNLQQT